MLKDKKLIIKRFSWFSSIIVFILGVLLLLFGIGVLHCQDIKGTDVCVGILLINEVVTDITSIKHSNEVS